MNTSRIIKKVSSELFKEIIHRYKSNIYINSHALVHLSDAQRKIFKVDELIKTLTQEDPEMTGIQKNKRYTSYFRRKWGYLKLVFEIKKSKIEIITFMNVDNMPNLEGLKNER